ncbi:MAG: aromatic amino acid lyase, partial [Thermomicrobiaceae bacterium]|nr:aromatic amino acid lyase [Thermomicrobiaceae bacterium]
TAARHLAQVVANTTRIVAIELLCAAQALDLAGRRPLAAATAAAYDAIRQQVPFLTSDDRSIHDLIERAAALVAEGALEDAVEATLAAPPR